MTTTPVPVRRKRLALGGIGSALLAKAACPVCWTFVAGLASAAGVGAVQVSSGALRLVSMAFLLIALVVLAWGARRRRGYGPLGLGVVAATALWSGEHVVASEGLALAGAGLLIVASAWNAWPPRSVAVPVVLRRAPSPGVSEVSP